MNAHTALAIETFGKLLRAERRVEKLQQEERAYLAGMPDEDRGEWFAITEGMRAAFEVVDE